MLEHVAAGDKIKLYLDGGADITGTWEGFSEKYDVHAPGLRMPDGRYLAITAPNGKRIRVRMDAVVAVVEL